MQKDIHVRHVLNVIAFHTSFVKENHIIRKISDDMKVNRKDKTFENIKKDGYDLYNKKSVRICDIIEYTNSQRYIEKTIINNENHIRITESGKKWLMSYHTDNSKSFAGYKQTINQKMENSGELKIKESVLALCFYNKKTAEDVYSQFSKKNDYSDFVKDYHNHLLNEQNHNANQAFIFHFMPILYTEKHQEKDHVTLTIKGIDQPNDLFLSRPYPNKNYVVAGIRNGQHTSASGFYPIVIPKENAPDSVQITLYWTIGLLKIEHHIHFTFITDPNIMPFFSSIQTVTGHFDISIKKINTLTKVDKFNSSNPICIHEEVELQNFPYYRHKAFYGDLYSQQYAEKKFSGIMK